MTFPHYRFGPHHTPRPLKYLVLGTLLISLFAGATHRIFPHYFGWASPQQILSLSSWGIDHFFVWQFFSYLFVHPLVEGLSFSFFLSLAFDCYLLWVIGASLIERKGLNHFFSLYFFSGILSGLLVALLQKVSHSPLVFSGNGTSIYALLIAWMALFPRAEFLLFLAIPVRASWLILGILGLNLLIDLSSGDWIRVLGYGSAALLGYLYGLIFWREREASSFYARAKRYDFKTGQAILNDEEFLEAMLTKIALKGKASLTWRERWRLRCISKKRNR
jgi:membrane associated rhomboid family serine protease